MSHWLRSYEQKKDGIEGGQLLRGLQSSALLLVPSPSTPRPLLSLESSGSSLDYCFQLCAGSGLNSAAQPGEGGSGSQDAWVLFLTL